MTHPHHHRTLGDLERLRQYDLGGCTNERIALLAMYDADAPLTLSELGERIPLSRAAMTTLADRLEADSLATRKTGSGDRRRIHLALTVPGRQDVLHALASELPDND